MEACNNLKGAKSQNNSVVVMVGVCATDHVVKEGNTRRS